jgi:hypothetical protein
MYNLTVETAHTFYVGEGQWLVHNTGCDPQSRKQYELLKKKLDLESGSESLLDDLWNGRNVGVMAGAGTKTAIRDVGRLISLYGDQAGDWEKISTGAHRNNDGRIIEIHAYRNLKTGEVVEPKTKLVK